MRQLLLLLLAPRRIFGTGEAPEIYSPKLTSTFLLKVFLKAEWIPLALSAIHSILSNRDRFAFRALGNFPYRPEKPISALTWNTGKRMDTDGGLEIRESYPFISTRLAAVALNLLLHVRSGGGRRAE